MKILITGICGFAGSIIARSLLEHGERFAIVGFDNLSRKGSETNVAPLRSLGIDVQVGDVRDRTFLASLHKADWILDCAANPSVLAGVDGSESRDLVEQNIYGTVNLLELCKTWNAGFTLLSTSRVYSIPPLASLPLSEFPTRFEPDFQPKKGSDDAKNLGITMAGIAESFSTAPPVSLYGSTKLCSELLALEYGAAFGFPVWINRCGVLAGAGQFGKADQGIFSFWIHGWKSGRALKYIGFGGTGKQVRDCLHPTDLVSVLQKQFLSSRPDVPKICNLSGGRVNSMSLLELSLWCAERFGSSPSESYISNSGLGENRPFDIPWMVLDHSLATEIWDWKPVTPISGVLEEIARHAEANPNWLGLVT